MKLAGLFFLLFISVTYYAQDTIYTRQGDVIQAKVLEVGVDQVKYKKTNNPDGPSYALLKSDITLIQYLNGTKDVFPFSEFDNELNSTSAVVPREKNEDLEEVLTIVANTLPYVVFNNWGCGWGWNSWAFSRPLFSGSHHSHHSHHSSKGHYGRRR